MPDEPPSPELEPLPLDPPTLLEAHDGSLEDTPFPPETPANSGGSALPSAAPHALGTIGDFEVVSKLGQGGMGAVYRARQISLGRLVALKILPLQFAEDEDFVSRFQREARLAASLHHPNLVRVYSSGLADGSHYIAMELVEGETLSRRVKRGPLPSIDAVRICLEVARALQCGWQSGQLIHRDVKPSNIYLSHSGEVKLGDLGIAKSLAGNTTGLTHTGAAMGTPHYISPEQARGDKALDFRTDLYSLGCTLYQCLTGRTPYEGSDPLTVMNLHLSGPPPAILKALPGCPIPLARLVGKMMKKQRHERHQSYEELIGQMESVLALLEAGDVDTGTDARLAMWREVGGGASATPPPAPSAPTAAKSKVLLYGGIAVGVVVLGAVAFFVWSKKEKPTKAQIHAREHAGKQPPATATPVVVASSPKSAEPWQDVLRDRAKLDLSSGAERTTEGVRFNPGGAAMLRSGQGPQRDGAARIRATFGGLAPSLRARWTNEGGHYQLHFSRDEKKIMLERYETATRQFTLLREFPLPESLQSGQDQELELRVVGQTLIAKLNGEVLGTVTDGTFPEGLFGVVATSGNNTAPALIKTLEVLDLDAPEK